MEKSSICTIDFLFLVLIISIPAYVCHKETENLNVSIFVFSFIFCCLGLCFFGKREKENGRAMFWFLEFPRFCEEINYYVEKICTMLRFLVAKHELTSSQRPGSFRIQNFLYRFAK